jgi:hypothetical protein
VFLACVRGREQLGDERSQRSPGRIVDGSADGERDRAEVGADLDVIAAGELIGAAQHDVSGIVEADRPKARVSCGPGQAGSKQRNVSDDLCHRASGPVPHTLRAV